MTISDPIMRVDELVITKSLYVRGHLVDGRWGWWVDEAVSRVDEDEVE